MQSNRKLNLAAEQAIRLNTQMSQIYGTKGAELRALMSEGEARKLVLAFIKSFPGTPVRHLRKVKTKMMVNALIQGAAENGNHFVTCFEGDFHFFYRGTLIYKWNAHQDAGAPVNAGEYEETASTINQRKEITKAIEHFREVVFTL